MPMYQLFDYGHYFGDDQFTRQSFYPLSLVGVTPVSTESNNDRFVDGSPQCD
tara:strand:+ start:333 stop:488 length:156 start_codon:yes stop_codon:yes gene_type:complete